MSMFKLRENLSAGQTLILGIAGFVVFVLVWIAAAELLAKKRPVYDSDFRLPTVTEMDSLSQPERDSLLRLDSMLYANAQEFQKVYPFLPPPGRVIKAIPRLVREDQLFLNVYRSIWLNLQGYFWAVFLSIPLGFLIGLLPIFRGMFNRQVDTLRYLPLTALTGIFITWFGLEDPMKIAFLAFGILVYLLPVVVQRIDEVDDVYLKTTFTLGAGNWQTIRTVYWPSVMSKLIDDIRVLTAISWTYIIIAELLNRKGGVGGLIWLNQRQGQIDKQFALLFIIILVGFLQDRAFVYMDRRLFPHKYYKRSLQGIKEVEYGLFAIILTITLAIFLPMILPAVGSSLVNLAFIVLIAALLIIIYGEIRVQKSLVE